MLYQSAKVNNIFCIFAIYTYLPNPFYQMTENQPKNDIKSIDGQLLNRGCTLGTTYNTGQKVLSCGRCKLSQFDWLKDYENQEVKGEVRLAEVRFKNDRKDYFTYPEALELEVGEFVAVETAIGHDIGIVTLLGEIVKRQMKRKRFRTPLEEMKKIYRRARVNDVEYQGDNTKAIIYYTADGRVDFRELIKKLAEEFHIRIEMRQIGVRQESAKLGGLGSCGRELCCASWITDFQSVTTNVARVQQLSPNPQKLAGMCGKLKCCLNYEYEAYVEALKAFSDPNIVLHVESGDAVHQKNDVFKGIMWYSYTTDKSNIMAIPVDKVKDIIAMNKKGQKPAKLEDYAVTKEAQTNTNEGYGEADLKKMSD